ncbi:equilibrative nucleoside transporter 3-like isoform X1 [Zophobas morio]|uniref:equilibrative nucleoside transporter 3-like isoform X1 n=1 Tax=Zophobas morio TaxID=2755281 RepID=UPI003083B261
MEHEEVSTPLKHRSPTTYILFYALGTVTLVPFYFFATAADYWMYKFRDPESNVSYSNENRTGLQAAFIPVYSTVSYISIVVFIILTIRWIRKLTILVRIIMTLCGTITVFVSTFVFVRDDTDSWQTGFMVTTLLTAFLLRGFCGIFLVTLFEMVLQFSPIYLAVIFSGQAICRILSALVEIVLLNTDADPAVNGFVYFLSGMLIVVLTLLGFFFSLSMSQFFKHHFWKEREVVKLEVSKEKCRTILHKLKFYLLSMVISSGSTTIIDFRVTSVVISVDQSSGSGSQDEYFGSVITLVYCISDYFGREFAMLLRKPSRPSQGLVLLCAACIRVVLVPLPVVCNEDYVYIIFVIIFASTNGFLINMCIIRGSQILADDEKPLAMLFIIIFIYISSVMGSLVGKGLVQAF